MKLRLLICVLLCSAGSAAAQGQWSPCDSINTGRYGAAGFAVGNYGYVVSGYHTTQILNDCWRYDPATDTWSQMANFPGGMRWNFSGFAIGSYGYVTCGFSSVQNYTTFNDLWRYDPAGNSWLARAAMPTTGRWHHVSFAVNGKGYVGVGQNPQNGMRNDFWEYNPVNDSWMQKQNFPYPVTLASSFTTPAFGYIVCGNDTTTTQTVQPSRNDIHQYDPVTDTWTQKTDIPGTGRQSPAAFSINGTGYVTLGKGGGYPKSMYAYNEVSDTWTLSDSFPAMGRWMTTTFTIGSAGYVVAGFRQTKIVTAEVWKYDTHFKGIAETGIAGASVFYSNGQLHLTCVQHVRNAVVSIYDVSGKLVLRNAEPGLDTRTNVSLDLPALAPGVYVCVLEDGNGLQYTQKFLITH